MSFTEKDYEAAISLLKYFEENAKSLCYDEEDEKALRRAAHIIEREYDNMLDAEAHAEATDYAD